MEENRIATPEMTPIGLIGGMCWRSTSVYYDLINEEVGRRLGGHNSAELHIRSVNYETYLNYLKQGDWQSIEEKLGKEAVNQENSGAKLFGICTNTMHKVAPAIQENYLKAGGEIVHIADPVTRTITELGITKIGLLGTVMTMRDGFYHKAIQERLPRHYSLDIVTPCEKDEQFAHDVIINEIMEKKEQDIPEYCLEGYQDIIEKMGQKGVEAVILGCTEIPILVKPNTSSIMTLDTTELHAMELVERSLQPSTTNT